MSNRKRYSAEFKAKVALEALKEQETIAQIASKYGVHPNQVSDWKAQAKGSLTSAFENPLKKKDNKESETIDKLHAIIGQLTAEKNFLERASKRI